MSIFSGRLMQRSLVGLLAGTAAVAASAAPAISDTGLADVDGYSLSPWILFGLAALFIGRIVDRSMWPEPPDPDQKPIGRPSRT